MTSLGPISVGVPLSELKRVVPGRVAPMPGFDPESGQDSCGYMVGTNDLEGLSFMIESGVLVRIEIASGAVTSLSGVGVGMPEDELKRKYGARLEQETHKYLHDPDLGQYGYYFTLWSADRRVGMRFETHQGRVVTIYAGPSSYLTLVEGCA